MGAMLYIGPGCIPGAYVVAPDDIPYMLASSAWLLATGDTPDKLFGECQFAVVAGDVAGESSVLRLRLGLEIGAGGAPIGSTLGGCFFRCARCFSSILSSPSLVKGFGSTSFMPAKVSHDIRSVDIVDLPCWKYIEMSSLLILEVIAIMGVLSNWRIR